LIHYTVRESKRARAVRLLMYPVEGLVVVVPPRFDWSRIPEIVERSSAWIERTSERLEDRRMHLLETASLPEMVHLEFTGEDWPVEYMTGCGRGGVVQAREAADSVLRLTGDVDDEEACREALKRWLRRKGRELLVPAAQELAAERGFRIHKVSVRMQKTIWASCAHDRSISLSAKLLFVPPELVEHVFLHEFCHTKQRNHSAAFWRLLGSYDPDWKEHRAELKSRVNSIPGWLVGDDMLRLP
jgi:predicted metal-dependent hydrolase